METGLRATSLEDVTIRQQYYCDEDVDRSEIREAVLLDLKHLVELAAQNGVQSGQTPQPPATE